MSILRTVFIFIFLSLLVVSAHAQREYTTDSQKAEKAIKEALQNYRMRDHQKALELVNEALQADKDFIEAYILKGQIYEEQDELIKAVDLYRTAIDMDPSFYPRLLFNTAELEFNTGQYEQAMAHFRRYRDREDTGTIKEKQAEQGIEACRFALKQKSNPVPFSPSSLGDKVNSRFHEYWPSITADGGTLVFTRLIPREDLDEMEKTMEGMDKKRRDFLKSMMSTEQEDFFISRKGDTGWSRAESLGKPINTKKNEGAQSLSADGQAMYFSACNQSGGEGGCDIYVSTRKEEGWSKPKNLGKPVNTEHWESQPSISPDGSTLYFASNRDGGKGKKDLWLSRRKENGEWSKPLNLGDSINTSQDEMAPFIHMDNRTLYFASQGWMGMGGLDLFRSQKQGQAKKNEWSHPENLGYPINTHNDEFGLIVNAPGTRAYYASNREDRKNRDLYSFQLPEQARPVPSSYISGRVYDAKTREPLRARFELTSLDSGRVIMESYSDSQTGRFLVCIPTNNNYLLNVSSEGYLFYSDHFTLRGLHRIEEPYEKDVPLQPIETGRKIVLRNVFFETDSFRLERESKLELNKLYSFLSQNSGLRIEISGHTDSIGTRAYNRELSHKRARSVYEYLVGKGIDRKRLEYKGYGESRPMAPNTTAEGRARNRRTQIKILGKE